MALRWSCFVWAMVALGGCDLFDQGDPPMDSGVNGGVGDPCSDPSQCRPGLVCRANLCSPSGVGVEGSVCALTGDCGEGLYCALDRTCRTAGTEPDGGDCSGSGDCEAGLVCALEGFGGRCRMPGNADLGDPCMTDLSCLAGLTCTMTGTARTCQNAPPFRPTDGGASTPPMLPPFWEGVTCEDDDTLDPVSHFEVPRGGGADHDFFRLPFPNDVRRTSTGLNLSGFPSPGTALPIDVIGRYIDAAEDDLDGFATNPVVYFRFSRPFVGDDIGEHVEWVDITPGSPTYGQARSFGWITTFGPITPYICEDWVAFRGGHGDPLRPGTTYAVYLTRGIRVAPTTSGGPVGPEFGTDSDLAALLGETVPGEASLATAHRQYAPFRAYLTDRAIDPSTILNAAVFTTQTVHDDVAAMREVIRAGSAPALRDVTVCGEGVTSPCDDGTEQRRCGPPNAAYTEIHARIELPIFQEGTPPYEEPENGGGLARDGSGRPSVVRTEPVCMLMTVPTGTAPAEGYPVVIAAHGTGGSFTGPIGEGLAERWATGDVMGTAPRAVTIAIDMPQHGSRRGTSTRSPDRLVFNFTNPRAARDVMLQGAADILALVHFAEQFSMDASTSPTSMPIDFDAERIVVWAHSQGATHASLMIGHEGGVHATLLSGIGGDLTQSLLTKTEPIDIAHIVPFALLEPTSEGTLNLGDMHPALSLFQMFFERSDPVNYARLISVQPPEGSTGMNVFMTYGLEDHFTTEATQRAYAQAAGFTLVRPMLVDIGRAQADAPLGANVVVGGVMRTIGMRQYRATAGIDGHFVSTLSPEGAADTSRFVLLALTGATPQIGM